MLFNVFADLENSEGLSSLFPKNLVLRIQFSGEPNPMGRHLHTWSTVHGKTRVVAFCVSLLISL